MLSSEVLSNVFFALATGSVDRAREVIATFEAIDDEARDILGASSKGCGGAPPGGQLRRFAG